MYRGRGHGFGKTPQAYLRSVRLDRAHEMLLAPGNRLTVADVAETVGYPHLSRFAGYYVERFGELPSDTRSRCAARAAHEPGRSVHRALPGSCVRAPTSSAIPRGPHGRHACCVSGTIAPAAARRHMAQTAAHLVDHHRPG